MAIKRVQQPYSRPASSSSFPLTPLLCFASLTLLTVLHAPAARVQRLNRSSNPLNSQHQLQPVKSRCCKFASSNSPPQTRYQSLPQRGTVFTASVADATQSSETVLRGIYVLQGLNFSPGKNWGIRIFLSLSFPRPDGPGLSGMSSDMAAGEQVQAALLIPAAGHKSLALEGLFLCAAVLPEPGALRLFVGGWQGGTCRRGLGGCQKVSKNPREGGDGFNLIFFRAARVSGTRGSRGLVKAE